MDDSPCDTLGLDNHPLAGWRYDRTDGLGVDFTSVSWYEPEQWWWDFGDPTTGSANTSTEKHPAHTFSAPGGYEVCLTVSNQYGSDTKCKVVEVKMTSGTSSSSGQEAVKVFPNPTSGFVTFSGIDALGYMAEVYDVVGLKLVSAVISGNDLDLSNLPSGIYYLRLTSPNGGLAANSKIVISK